MISVYSYDIYMSRKQVKQFYIKQLNKLKIHHGFIRYWKYRIFKYKNWYDNNKADIIVLMREGYTWDQIIELN